MGPSADPSGLQGLDLQNYGPSKYVYRAKLKLKTVVIGFIYSKPVGLG